MSVWQWIAYGKHPAARDYIRLGSSFPLGDSFFGWIEQGYARYCRDRHTVVRGRWHFWLQGTAREELTCGVMLSSVDAIGRPYPLLIMGGGAFPGWETWWEELPLACEGIWNAAGALTTAAYTSVTELVSGLNRLTAPDVIGEDDTLPPGLPFSVLHGDFGSEFGLYSLEAPNGSSIATAAAMHLSLLQKKRNASPPVAIFIGGGETAHMAIMRRPLKSLDFEVLWSQYI